MILASFLRALGQFGDPRFRRVVWIGVGLAFALLIAVYALFLGTLEALLPETVTLPVIGPIGGIDTLLTLGSAAVMLGLSVFLMVPVASAFTGIFLDDVAQAVEDRHYPALPAAPRPRLLDNLVETANFIGLLLAVNVAAIFVYPFAGLAAPAVFWGLNGWLLGREYFTLVATRRLGRTQARALRARHGGKVWLAGVLMAAPLSVPVVNLFVPVLGVATFTHLFHRLMQRQS